MQQPVGVLGRGDDVGKGVGGSGGEGVHERGSGQVAGLDPQALVECSQRRAPRLGQPPTRPADLVGVPFGLHDVAGGGAEEQQRVEARG